MICHKYKTLFIHQRKCAGTSIISSFGLSPRDTEWHLFNNGSQDIDFSTGGAFSRLYGDYHIASIVRNPWDRFVSAWKYLPATRNRTIHDVLLNLPSEGHDYRHITRPQAAILIDQGKPIYDSLMRYESLQADYETYCDIIGKPRVTLPHANRTSRLSYEKYFDARAKSLFYERFSIDIDFFGYQY